ncbi:MAG: SPOR domain-containing protein [Pseudomonadales bacterium]
MAQRKQGKKPAAGNDGSRKGGRGGASLRRSASSTGVAPPKRLRIIATLLVALAFVGALYWLARSEVPGSGANDASDDTGNSPAKTSARNAALKKDTEYTFHSRLEDFEIEVDSGDTARSESGKHVYLIQAGSFKTRAQAERRLVELKLLSLDPVVEERTNSDGSHWQRVLLGPYDSRSRMSGVRNVLLSNDIDAMVMRRRAP